MQLSQTLDTTGIVKSGKKQMSGPAISQPVISNPQHAMDYLGKNALSRSAEASFVEIVEELVKIIGRKPTAYIASLSDARALDEWLTGQRPTTSMIERLRFAYRLVFILSSGETSAVVKNWLVGVNPELDDAVPISLLRDGDLGSDGERLVDAAMVFVIGG